MKINPPIPKPAEKLQTELAVIINKMPNPAQRMRAAEVINAFFKTMKPDMPTLH